MDSDYFCDGTELFVTRFFLLLANLFVAPNAEKGYCEIVIINY